MKFYVEEIEQIVNATRFQRAKSIPLNLTISEIKIDTRTLGRHNANAIFIAIKGKNHNAHNFVKEAQKAGINNFILSEDIQIKNANVWYVNNTVNALQLLAKNHREKFNIPVIGITGSNGKTIVKEWLKHLLKSDFSIVKSPKSYNSQIGVPLSVLKIESYHTLGIFEAGISEVGEMEKLEEIIQPTIGVFTNLGKAHDEGFPSIEEKFKQKLKLFKNTKVIFEHINLAVYPEIKTIFDSISSKVNKEFDCELHKINKKSTELTVVKKNKKEAVFQIPFTNEIGILNARLCAKIVSSLKPNFDKWYLFATLPVISMRLEQKKGVNNIQIINDTYNADLDSLKIAIKYLNQKAIHDKSIILSDLSGMEFGGKFLSTIKDLLIKQKLKRLITVGKKWGLLKNDLNNQAFEYHNFPNTLDLINHLNSLKFNNETLLVKGERKYNLEQVTDFLSIKKHETVLEINQDAISHNFSFFKSKLRPKTKVMVMVKSFAYGVGAFEIAKLLEHKKVDYLGVAYTDEGVLLRKRGIKVPIMVMNAKLDQFTNCLSYKLEPVIFDLVTLQSWVNSEKYTFNLPMHIKVNTGMNRLGFNKGSFSKLLAYLQNKKVNILSVLSHLASTENIKYNYFALKQMLDFSEQAAKLEAVTGQQLIKHILNSSGVLNYPKAQMQMVRLGLGIFGFSQNPKLKPCLSLKTFITQIEYVNKAESVGYGYDTVLSKNTIIATLGIGYADGLMRKAGNGNFSVKIKGKLYPTIGNICMDVCMVDLGMNDAQITTKDEVIIFDEEYSINHLAKSCETINYEIMTNISRRVKRVYWQEEV